MLIGVFVIGFVLAIGLFIAGVSRKKIVLAVLGAIMGMILLGLLTVLVLVNSPFWSM